MKNRLYLVEDPNGGNYDTYYSFVVCTANVDDARYMYPSDRYIWRTVKGENHKYGWCELDGTEADYLEWTDNPELLEITEIGIADKSIEDGTIVIASYHAG
jgi:hypothetical protein